MFLYFVPCGVFQCVPFMVLAGWHTGEIIISKNLYYKKRHICGLVKSEFLADNCKSLGAVLGKVTFILLLQMSRGEHLLWNILALNQIYAEWLFFENLAYFSVLLKRCVVNN